MLLNRLELKYLVDRTTRTALTRDLRALMRRDEHAGPDGTYLVRSLYFDSPDFRAYHEKMAGEAVRHKPRIRAYGADPGRAAVIRFEIKSRYLSVIRKTTAEVTPDEYREIEVDLLARRLPRKPYLERYPGLAQFVRLQRLYSMEPRILIQYRREAYERRELARVRVNFDDQLVAVRSNLLLAPIGSARAVLRATHAVFEIKVDGPMPRWMHTLISKYDLVSSAISKYCLAVRSEAYLSAVGRLSD